MLRSAGAAFDRVARLWESPRVVRGFGTLTIVAFLAALVVTEAGRQGLHPEWFPAWVPTNPFAAVYLAFTLLLVAEVLGLVFTLPRSVADSVGKQFELLSLILLRKAFLAFSELHADLSWGEVSGVLLEILADAGGALAVFAAVGLFFRIQRHRPITRDELEEAGFVLAKKVLAGALLLTFVAMAIHDLWLTLTGTPYPFFEAFYVVLIFSDILVVLISYRYSSSYHVVFRNSGFALSTVLIRFALTAPRYYNAALAVGAALFAVGVSLAYNAFAPLLEEEKDTPLDELEARAREKLEAREEAGGTSGEAREGAGGTSGEAREGASPGVAEGPNPA